MRINETALKKIAKTAQNQQYHSWHKHQAWQLIGSMTSLAGRRRSPALFRQCDEYARDVLGAIKYSPWLKAYTVFSGTFREGWVPDNYYGAVVVPKLKGGYGLISDYKSISARLFQTELLPDLAYSVNGMLYTQSMNPVKRCELKTYLFERSKRIVYKLDGGKQGTGVVFYDEGDFPSDSFTFENGVFQSYIVQHPFFDAFNDKSVSTLRITTVVDDESHVSCRAAYLRSPRSADTHVMSETAVKIAISPNGELHDEGYLPNWVPVAHHPDSKKEFAHQVVPNFRECVETCVELHRRLMFPRIIGWDAIIGACGNVAIMEWNGIHNDIKFSEAAVGPCFADLGWQNLWRS